MTGTGERGKGWRKYEVREEISVGIGCEISWKGVMKIWKYERKDPCKSVGEKFAGKNLWVKVCGWKVCGRRASGWKIWMKRILVKSLCVKNVRRMCVKKSVGEKSLGEKCVGEKCVLGFGAAVCVVFARHSAWKQWRNLCCLWIAVTRPAAQCLHIVVEWLRKGFSLLRLRA